MIDLDYLPETPRDKYESLWTDEIDETLLKYWPIKQHREISKAIGIPEWKLRERYREIVKV